MATIYNEYMKSQMVSKNEYIALKLTKMWCDQPGTAHSTSILERYRYFRDSLNKEERDNGSEV